MNMMMSHPTGCDNLSHSPSLNIKLTSRSNIIGERVSRLATDVTVISDFGFMLCVPRKTQCYGVGFASKI